MPSRTPRVGDLVTYYDTNRRPREARVVLVNADGTLSLRISDQYNIFASRDPSFRLGTGAPNANGTGSVASRDTAVGRSDSFSWKVVCDGSIAAQGLGSLGKLNADNGPPVIVGQQYTFSVFGLGQAGGEQVKAEIRWTDAGGGIVSTTAGAPIVLATGAWTRASVTGVAPPGTVTVTGKLYTTPTPQVATFWADDIQLELGSVVSPFLAFVAKRTAHAQTNVWDWTA